MMRVLVTGSAGFIGYHLSELLLAEGNDVIGLDAHDVYYDPALKEAREARLRQHPRFTAIHARVEEPDVLADIFATHRLDLVVHLAAQAGVRHSIDNPRAYLQSNLIGTFELLEAARAHPPRHLLLASTSSAYGANTRMPYRETDKADLQMSFYAASKKSTEAMAHSYSHLFGLPVTMFRFFTVYGPWGRPDMAPWLFTSAILAGKPIRVFNHGDMRRDFTYVTDLVRAIRLLMDTVPGDTPVGPEDSLSSVAPFRVVNIGNGAPVELLDFIAAFEAATGREAIKDLLPMQPGDVPATWADTTLLRSLTGYAPETQVREGVAAYVDWFRSYYL
ncbi:NAD-dependent epimerase/dehydratase family protein [Paracoccus aestuariivivens]|uniref:NAD-dependent epimerase/dehydratase family protein n=1 Tax=Paracoccus aestuariivivens TaxID=1820333 RepID=A0A6L6JB22_9RHOB|nr:NAD-dependent epimerase/dehydratase family protein [Paracoccus aestuariivivens]MTH78328.1 NAD-dependent epimerase/dehydratase family protein [Paracoccus aestuariivivens]